MSTTHLQESLVRHHLLSADDLAYTLRAAQGTEFTWLELLVLWGLVDEASIVACAQREVLVPKCNAELTRVPDAVVALVPAEVAIEHRLVPIGLDADGDVRVAMADPSDSTACDELGFFCGRRILREVAGPKTIAQALHSCYGVETPLWPPGQYPALDDRQQQAA